MKFYDSLPDKVYPCPFNKILRIMKITFLILLTALMQVYAVSKAQNISLSEKNVSLSQVFKDIKQQTGIKFLYNPEMLETAKLVSIQVNNQPLNKVLDACFEGQPLSYTIFEGNIVVREKEESLLDRITSAFDRSTIQGTVTDEQGQALPGVTIREKGTDNAVISGTAGDFKISVTNKNAILVFSYIGFERLEIPAHEISPLKAISLKLNAVALKEVIVNKGYYSTTQELNTGNVSSVSSKTIEQQPVNNPLAALEGQVPGLFITQSTGLPGGAFTVQIRGQNSIANGNDPFYVIDGVPYISSPQLSANNNLNPAGGNALNFINPYDIVSIDILKDADATAIYGSRGANGVVLITTKKGKAGQTKIDFNVYQGVGAITHSVQYVNTSQYLQMRHEAFKNDGATPDPNVDFDVLGSNGWDTTRTIDWEKELVGGTAHYTDAQGSVSGGNELTQYIVGGAYHRETTVFPGTTSDQKGSMHFSITSASRNKRFTMTFSGNYVVDQTDLPAVEPMSQMFYLAPDTPNPFNADGSLNWSNGSWANDSNPYAYFKQTYSGRTTNLVSNLLLSYNILLAWISEPA
jgi:TonB-dependent SusC/RagA subfamily outer membrane receptor